MTWSNMCKLLALGMKWYRFNYRVNIMKTNNIQPTNIRTAMYSQLKYVDHHSIIMRLNTDRNTKVNPVYVWQGQCVTGALWLAACHTRWILHYEWNNSIPGTNPCNLSFILFCWQAVKTFYAVMRTVTTELCCKYINIE